MKLKIDVEIKGTFEKVGSIAGSSTADACFSYDPEYIAENGKPISINLPAGTEKN